MVEKTNEIPHAKTVLEKVEQARGKHLVGGNAGDVPRPVLERVAIGENGEPAANDHDDR